MYYNVRTGWKIAGIVSFSAQNAIIFCIDEKPNIQALERRVGYAVSADKKLVQGFENTYKRNRTLNVFTPLIIIDNHSIRKHHDKCLMVWYFDL